MSTFYYRIFRFATEAPEVDEPNLSEIESCNELHGSLLPRELAFLELVPVGILYADRAIAVK